VSDYAPVFEHLYLTNAKRYATLRERAKKRVDKILTDPYQGTEQLGHPAGGMNLRGCRSAHIDRNFRIIFVICEECRREPNCEFCLCEGRADNTVVFLNLGPHDKAYAMK
jgi:mRNA-degrading endonuclease YafQ of YafQ-DinJ toxin-antitoxin module